MKRTTDLTGRLNYHVDAYTMTGVKMCNAEFATLAAAMAEVKKQKADVCNETVRLSTMRARPDGIHSGGYRNTLWARRSGKAIHQFYVAKY